MKIDFKPIVVILAILLMAQPSIHAEEGGSGHYMPGSMASFVDGVSAGPTFLARLNYLYYSGGAGAQRSIPISGQTAVDADAVSNALGLTLLWSPKWNLGGKWNYAMSMTIPWVSIEVTADIESSAFAEGQSLRRSDSESGLGDIFLLPLMLNYQINSDLGTNFRLGVYAPTGDYEVGRLANPGKNFWTIEPTASLIYFGQKNGREGSLFFGIDFNTENEDTKYHSGTQAHLDGTLAQHFPLWGGLAGAGVSGFYYQQLTADSGEGANLGDFKAQTTGLGPALSFISKVAGRDVIAELKWLHEFETKKRLEGDTIFFKFVAKF